MSPPWITTFSWPGVRPLCDTPVPLRRKTVTPTSRFLVTPGTISAKAFFTRSIFVLPHLLEQLDFARHRCGDVLHHHIFGRDDPAGIFLTELFGQQEVVRMRKAVLCSGCGGIGSQIDA